MRAGRFNPARTEIKTENSVILFWVGNHRMGISASALKEIRNPGRLSLKETNDRSEESSGCDAILSAGTFFGIRASAEGRLLVLRPQNVAVRVDKVERMIEVGKIFPLPQAFQGVERKWYRGITLVGEAIVPLLNPETFVHAALSQAAEFRSNEDGVCALVKEVRA